MTKGTLESVVVAVLALGGMPLTVSAGHAPGAIAPNFTSTLWGTNTPVSLYDYAGSIVVLDYFAYWCIPCQQASADLENYVEKYYRSLGGNPSHIPVVVLSINTDGSVGPTNSYITNYGLETVLNGGDSSYGYGGIPIIAIINGATGTNYRQWQILYDDSGYDGSALNYFRNSFINTVRYAINSNWTGGGSALWSDPTNWSTGSGPGAPGAADTVSFNQPATASGATINLSGGVTVNNILFNTPLVAAYNLGSGGVNNQTLSLNNGGAITMGIGVANNQTFNAALVLGDGSSQTNTITNYSSTGTLIFAGNISGGTSGAAGIEPLVVTGPGNTTIGGVISTGGASSVALTKSGGGTLTLNGSSVHTFNGGVNLNGGTLALDFTNLTSGYTNLVNNGNALVLGGGSLAIKGKNAAANTSQTFASTTVTAGGGSILINPNGAGASNGTTLNLNALATTAAGGSLLVGTSANPGTGTVTINTSTPKVNNIYGGRVVFTSDGGTTVNWATTTSSGPTYTLSALASGGYTTLPASGGTGVENYRATAGTSLTGAINANSLKIENSTGAQALGANLLTLNSGGLLISGTAAASITGTAGGTRLTSGNGSGSYDLIVHQYNTGGATISAVIGDNVAGGTNPVNLVKAGTQTLTLSGANTFTGITSINSGTLKISNNLALSGTSAIKLYPGARLEVNATNFNLAKLDPANGGSGVVAGSFLRVDNILSPSALTVPSPIYGTLESYVGNLGSWSGTLNFGQGGTYLLGGGSSAQSADMKLYGDATMVHYNTQAGNANVGVVSSGDSGTHTIFLDQGDTSGTVCARINTGIQDGAGKVNVTLLPNATWMLGNPAGNAANVTYTGVLTIGPGATLINGLLGTYGQYGQYYGGIGNAGSPSVLGLSSSDPSNLVFNGGTLSNVNSTQSAATTNKLFTIVGGTSATLTSQFDGITSDHGTEMSMWWTGTGSIAITGVNTSQTLYLSSSVDDTGKVGQFWPVLPDNGTGKTSLVKSGPNTWNIYGSNTYSGGTTIQAGTLRTLNFNALGGATAGVIVQTGGTLRVDVPGLKLASLTVNGTVTTTSIAAGGAGSTGDIELGTVDGSGNTVVAGTLTMGSTGLMDLQDRTLLIHYTQNPTSPVSRDGPAEYIQAQLIKGRNAPAPGGVFDGPWNGAAGITSTRAMNDFITANGVLQNNQAEFFAVGYGDTGKKQQPDGSIVNKMLIDDAPGFTNAGGNGIGSTVFVRYTRVGDATMDGIVGNNDVTVLGLNFDPTYNPAGAAGPKQWYDGDFNFNGIVDNNDVTILGLRFDPTQPAAQYASLSSQFGANFAAAFTTGYEMSHPTSSVVPEPGALTLLGVGAMALIRRRRRA